MEHDSMPDSTNSMEHALLTQLEYYFSRKNLAKDTFLVSQMNAELYVPISVVAGFARIKDLTTDESVLLRVLKQSPNVVVDEQNGCVRPNFQLRRNTIILRDIPSDANPDQVLELFKGKSSRPVPAKDIRPEIGNTWFVEFDTESDALKMLNRVRGKTWNGVPISSRLKSESLLKTTASPGLAAVSRRAIRNGVRFQPKNIHVQDSQPSQSSEQPSSEKQEAKQESRPQQPQGPPSYADVLKRTNTSAP